MKLITWGTAYNIGIDEVDDQHIGLVNMINDIHERIEKDQIEGLLETVIPKLVRYTHEHFEAEESLMARYKYPGYEEHKKQHQLFITEIKSTIQNISKGGKAVKIKLLVFLKDWLLNHIAFTDKKMGDYLIEKLK